MKKPLTLLGVLSLLIVACAQPDKGSVDKPVSDRTMSDRTMSDRAMSDRTMSDRAMSDKTMSEKPMSVLDIIDEAQAAHQTAIDQDHAWTKTSQFLASAKDKLARGDESAARVDAQRALFIANASVAQANREKNAWKGRVPQQ